MPDPVANYLREQAIRMRRTKWQSPWLLADELWLILSGIDAQTTGPLSIGLDPLTAPNIDLPPLNELNIPALDLEFPELQQTGTAGLPDNDETTAGGFKTRTETVEHLARTTIPAQVVSGSGPYKVKLFPNSTQWKSPRPNFGAIGLAEGANSFEVDAILLGTGTLEANDYVSCYRAARYEITTTTVVNSDTGDEVSRSTQVALQEAFHEIVQAPATGGGKSVFAGKVVSGSGDEYVMDLYPDGLSGETTRVNAVQLFISSDEQIPADSWTLVLEVRPKKTDANGDVTDEGEYLMQFPTWL